MKKYFAALICVFALDSSAATSGFTPPKLEDIPLLNIDRSRVTVSGVSSGGFMAIQMHVAHSALLKGAASVAGGIWECTLGNVMRIQGICMNHPNQIKTSAHVDLVHERAKRGEIDAPSNLTDSRIAIFASPKDTVIQAVNSDKLAEFYEAFVPKTSITRLSNPNAAHGFPTLSYGGPCPDPGTPWLLNCADDVAGKILAAIEPGGQALAARTVADPNSILYFDQNKYVTTAASMYSWGALYIPKVCRDVGVQCGVHVALHGCQMTPEFIDAQFIENAGYNEWAESNKLIVLYPQSTKSLGNPNGCWDWYGFTGKNFTTKSGVQIEGIRKLLLALGAT